MNTLVINDAIKIRFRRLFFFEYNVIRIRLNVTSQKTSLRKKVLGNLDSQL